MKNIVLTLSDAQYEKLRFDAIYQGVTIEKVIKSRLLDTPYDPIVEEAYDRWMEKEIYKMIETNG